jgi:RHS repeat-associated protein
VPSATYDTANQQLAFGPTTMTFDANGNLATQTDAVGTTTYTWDARNRLVALNGPGRSAAFQYDVTGRRTARVVNSEARTYQSDDADVARETVDGTEVSHLSGPGIDAPLTRSSGATVEHYLQDALGNVVALTDGAGQVSTTHTYEPFGRVSLQGTPTASRLAFTGRDDDGTGLYYYRARYYAPGLGRFISEDPIGFIGGANLYAYAMNSPVTWNDPSGLWSPAAHDVLFQEGLQGVASPADIAALQAASREFDERTGLPVSTAHMHCMARPGQNPDEARRWAENFIEQGIRTARNLAAGGNRPGALRELAEAMHTMQDCTSPEHVDEQGRCRVWDPRSASALRHSKWEFQGNERVIQLRRLHPDITRRLNERMVDAYRRVFGAGP